MIDRRFHLVVVPSTLVHIYFLFILALYRVVRAILERVSGSFVGHMMMWLFIHEVGFVVVCHLVAGLFIVAMLVVRLSIMYDVLGFVAEGMAG